MIRFILFVQEQLGEVCASQLKPAAVASELTDHQHLFPPALQTARAQWGTTTCRQVNSINKCVQLCGHEMNLWAWLTCWWHVNEMLCRRSDVTDLILTPTHNSNQTHRHRRMSSFCVGLNPTVTSLLSLILTWHSSIIFSVRVFDVKGLLITISQTRSQQQEALCMALMSLLGFWTALQSWFEQHRAFCLQPFSLLLKRCWNSFAEEINVKNAQQLCWDEEQGWLTVTVTWYAWRSVHRYFSHEGHAMGYDPPSAGHVSVSHVREDAATTASLFLCLHTGGRRLAAAPFGCTNTRRWKDSMKSLYSQCAVIPFLQESYRLKYLSNVMQWG